MKKKNREEAKRQRGGRKEILPMKTRGQIGQVPFHSMASSNSEFKKYKYKRKQKVERKTEVEARTG